MATGVKTETGCSLISVEGVTLENTYNTPWYNGIVVHRNKIIVIDFESRKVLVHRLQDGKLLVEFDTPGYRPCGICVINDTEICLFEVEGLMNIMSIDSTHNTRVITWTTTLYVEKVLNWYHAVVSFKKDFAISGIKDKMLCWCIVSGNDGHIVGTIHRICRGSTKTLSYLTTKDGIIYISCDAGVESYDTGVIGYDVQNQGKIDCRYRHKDLKEPRGILIDQNGYLFVCNSGYPYPCIHHLTTQCKLVSIFKEGIPSPLFAIFYDNGHIYGTCWDSNHITIYRTQYSDPVIPAEVLEMDASSLQMYKDALRAGKEKVYNIRVMVVGQYGVGKTTLTKRLLGKAVSERNSTEGIDVHVDCSKVSLTTGEWKIQDKNAEQFSRLQRLLKLLNEHAPEEEVGGYQVTMQCNLDDLFVKEKHGSGHPQRDKPVSAKPYIRKEVKQNSSQLLESSVVRVDARYGVQHVGQENTKAISTEAKSNENVKKKDAVMEILQLVNENAGNLNLEKNTVEYASLAMWDFAGQFVYYTTHQTFLTSHAIYLLVIDLSQQITDTIKDDKCFLDTKGIQLCKVYELLEIWLNSIHSCAPFPQSGIPPVILVGTHVDKLPKSARQKVIKEYFRKIRHMLKDKPSILHLVDDIAIDNTQHDPDLGLEQLRKRIFELAKQQPHWGEERPARWLPMEQAIMTLKTSGVKVASLSLVEKINRSQSVRIDDSKELDLFLRFQHAMGTILYFSVEELREKIMLDPQWMIDALKSLITAEDFMRQNPAITRKWFEFKEKGKLTHELLDAIWSKQRNPEFHDNKDHILLVMEKLNIIARPKTYSQDGKEIKVENYFLAPCMLSETTPMEIVSPKQHPHKESSSVLCFVFVERFLPSPIFHRLLAASVAHWPIAMKNSENLIYCGCAVFDLGSNHLLTMFFREHVIFARVTRMGTIEKTPSSKLCIEVREFITMTLTNIIGYLGESLQFELFIRCPESDEYGVNCLTSVAVLKRNVEVSCHFHHDSHMIVSTDMLKFWFQDEGNPVKRRGGIGELHQKVLNRCWPALVRDLEFTAVSDYIIQEELFDDVTIRNIKEQKTTSDKIRELIDMIQQSDQGIYEKFKKCLVQANQEFLKDLLEGEEKKVAMEMQGPASETPEAAAAPTTKTETARSTNPVSTTQAPTTKAMRSKVPTTKALTAAPITKAPVSATTKSKPLADAASTNRDSTTQVPKAKAAKPAAATKTNAPASAACKTKAETAASTAKVSTTQAPKSKSPKTAAQTKKAP